MTMADPTPAGPFGRRAATARDVADLLALERREGRAERFGVLDGLIGSLLVRMARGERLATLRRGVGGDGVAVEVRSAAERALVDEHFALARQQARGAWFLPEEPVALKVGVVNLAAHFRAMPRFASGIAQEERGKVRLDSAPDALLLWSLLEPLAERLFLPLELRGRLAGTLDLAEQLDAWTRADAFLDALGFHVGAELGRLRYGSGWSRLRVPEQVAAKQGLLAALAEQVEPTMGARYRALLLRELVERYYVRAKKGPPLRRQALTPKPMERVLATVFGGDWLAFLDYLGEEPHPDERVATSLPEPRLFVGGGARATEVAAQQGLPVEVVEQMLAAFWGGSTASPVERRVGALRRYWEAFDQAHARQAPGMAPLWGLHQEDGLANLSFLGDAVYDPTQARRVLPGSLVDEIEQLWGTVLLPRWPDRVVSEPFPFQRMAAALGPALAFWHSVGLTAWFICEGPMSRTDFAGLAQYHRREIAALEALGCAPDPALYAELIAAGKRLGPPQTKTRQEERSTIGGVTISLVVSDGPTRRAGFERVREVITRHRRAWAEAHLERYLRARWEGELRAAARAYHKQLEERGRGPTLKQFARDAEAAANHWFGGDLADLYAALGEKIERTPVRDLRMPADRPGFALAVFEALGGRAEERHELLARQQSGAVTGRREQEAITEAHRRDDARRRLAAESLRYVQLTEALGRPVELKEFGASSFEYYGTALKPEVEAAWMHYRDTVEGVLTRETMAVSAPSHRADGTSEQTTPPGLATRSEDPAPAKEFPDSRRAWWQRLIGR